jgi:hypothetical protein
VPMSEIQQPVVLIPEQTYYTLRGISKQSDEYVSFFEDSRSMAVTKFRKGDFIAGGKITDIALDFLSYQNEGKAQKVEIGMNLQGEISGTESKYLAPNFNNSQGNSRAQAAGQFQNRGQTPQMGGQIQGVGEFPQMGGQSQGMGQSPQRGGQFSGMDQGQGVSQMPGMDQPQGGRGQQDPGITQSQPAGQTQATGTSRTSSASAGQGQTTAQPPMAVQSNAAIQTVDGAQQQGTNTDSESILQRLKERRKKELE